MSDTTDIKCALLNLSLVADQLARKPHTLTYLTGYEPTRADIRGAQDPMIILAGAVDRVFSEWGRLYESLGIIGGAERREDFARPVMDAIEGRALYAIESGIESRIEDAREAAE